MFSVRHCGKMGRESDAKGDAKLKQKGRKLKRLRDRENAGSGGDLMKKGCVCLPEQHFHYYLTQTVSARDLFRLKVKSCSILKSEIQIFARSLCKKSQKLKRKTEYTQQNLHSV